VAHDVPGKSPRRTSPLPDGAGVPGDWLSLGPASRLVGVDPDTLRRWADDGRVRAFATPGGHRRFATEDLQRLVQSRSPRRRSLSTLGATPDRVVRAYARSYRATAAAGGIDPLGAADRDAFRTDGRHLVGALLGYLDARSPEARARHEADAAQTVRATALRLAATGADISAGVSTFVAARRPLLAELAAVGRRRALDVAGLTALYDEAAALLDRLLLEFVDAFAASPEVPVEVR
jgi:excisionase family DNA binding protein